MKNLYAKTVKQAINSATLYACELPDMQTPRQAQWNNGGLCPFHDDHRPNSFYVNVDTGAFKCFSCGNSGGDIIDFTQLRYGISFREALQKLADEWGY